jgi:fatty-acyl-CoA synthase
MLPGMMMDRPLLISGIIDYAAQVHGTVEVVSQAVEGGIHRYTFADLQQRSLRLAAALLEMGVEPGDRVATLAWNGYRHLELYYAVSGIGAVCHTINPRLFFAQQVYIANHARDTLLFFDTTFAPLVEKLHPELSTVREMIAMTDRAHMPALGGVRCYEDLIAACEGLNAWPDLDENAAAGLCYTSGTTGEPKGALYSHRSSVLHALFTLASNLRAFGRAQSILPVVPLFHVNAWGTPYIAPLTGTKLVFPGSRLDGPSLFELMDLEQVRSAWGVPTVWAGLLAEMKVRARRPVGLKEVLVGGSAPPRTMIETFERDYNVRVVQGWGMTEMSPIGSIGCLSPEEEELPFEKKLALKATGGRRLYGVELKIVDGAGRRLVHDGVATGELCVRGPTVVSGYFGNERASREAIDSEGWFRTGDIARIDPQGFLSIADRAKDLIKSGGEWISSIEIEDAAMCVPGLLACAVVAMPDERWGERPLLVAVKAPEASVDSQGILAALATKLAKWQLPDRIVFADRLPMTATGKISKKDLRAAYASFSGTNEPS